MRTNLKTLTVVAILGIVGLAGCGKAVTPEALSPTTTTVTTLPAEPTTTAAPTTTVAPLTDAEINDMAFRIYTDSEGVDYDEAKSVADKACSILDSGIAYDDMVMYVATAGTAAGWTTAQFTIAGKVLGAGIQAYCPR